MVWEAGAVDPVECDQNSTGKAKMRKKEEALKNQTNNGS